MSTESTSGSSSTVSIICRSMGRPELKDALTSVAAQKHHAIQFILVDAANSGVDVASPDLPDSITVTHVNLGKTLNRAAAANAGLDAVTGDYVLFLDEDDWISPDHISVLLECLADNPDIKAAYSSTRKTDQEGNELDLVFQEDYQPLLLMRDNFIPIHAMLFDAKLLANGCRFDEQFDVFEDWDFWLQLNQYTAFRHVDQITAFYRAGGESDTGIDDIEKRFDPEHPSGIARAKVLNKWLKSWNGEQVNALLGDLDRVRQTVSNALQAEHTSNLKLQKQISELLSSRETLTHQLNIANQKEAESQQIIADLRAENRELQKLRQDYNALRDHLELMQNSLSWKLTRPLRGLRRLFSGSAASNNKAQDDQQ